MQAGDRHRLIGCHCGAWILHWQWSVRISTTSVGGSGTILTVTRSNCGAIAADRLMKFVAVLARCEGT
jgi:hypothetical protein